MSTSHCVRSKAKHAVEVATKMLVKEYPLQEIVDMTELPLEQVLELQKKIKVPVNNES